jgi:hypothetical protein
MNITCKKTSLFLFIQIITLAFIPICYAKNECPYNPKEIQDIFNKGLENSKKYGPSLQTITWGSESKADDIEKILAENDDEAKIEKFSNRFLKNMKGETLATNDTSLRAGGGLYVVFPKINLSPNSKPNEDDIIKHQLISSARYVDKIKPAVIAVKLSPQLAVIDVLKNLTNGITRKQFIDNCAPLLDKLGLVALVNYDRANSNWGTIRNPMGISSAQSNDKMDCSLRKNLNFTRNELSK